MLNETFPVILKHCVFPSKDFLHARDGPQKWLTSEIFREGLKAKVGSWDHRKFDDDRCMRGSATGTKNNAPPGNAGAVRL